MTSVSDLDALPELNAAATAKLLGVALVKFNRLVRDGLFVRLKGRHNAYNVKDVVSAYLEHLTDGHLQASEMARHLDLSPQRLSKLVDENTLARPETNRGFDRDRTRIAYIKHLRKVRTGQVSPDGTSSYAEARTKLIGKQTEAVDFKNAVARGDYAPIELLDDLVARHAAVVRERVLTYPSIAPELVDCTVEQIAEKLRLRSHEVLKELSDERTFDWARASKIMEADHAAGNEDLPAASRSQSGRVLR
jgi:phage terminase Nu1 subunit (DNA packaging protein)